MKLFSFMIDIINVSFRPNDQQKFSSLVEDSDEPLSKKQLIKMFKNSNTTLISKMFRSLIEQKLECPHC